MARLILVVDDQYAKDEKGRKELATKLGVKVYDVADIQDARNDAFTYAAVVTSGQTHRNGRIENEQFEIDRAVSLGWGDSIADEDRWALVFHDVQFKSGKVGIGGQPLGNKNDDSFGEQSRDHLLNKFPDLPLVMLTSLHESKLRNGRSVPFCSKADLSEKQLKFEIAKNGRVSDAEWKQLMDLPCEVLVASAAMRNCFIQARQFASVNSPVIVLGESGSGKESLARYIHFTSERAKHPLVAFSAAGIPADIAESTLFGHVRGAFTNAIADKMGLIESAEGGSLFIDEIGSLDLAIHQKLNRAMDPGCFTKMGSTTEIQTKARFIFATSSDISEMVAKGEFKNDLWTRISSLQLNVPPLRDRTDEIVPLAESFLAKHGKVNLKLSDRAKEALTNFDFSRGNVRTLKSIIERVAIVIGSNRTIQPDDLQLHLYTDSRTSERPVQASSPVDTPRSKIAAREPVGELVQFLNELSATRLPASSTEHAFEELIESYAKFLENLLGATLRHLKDAGGQPEGTAVMKRMKATMASPAFWKVFGVDSRSLKKDLARILKAYEDKHGLQ
jgi:DNA-binding NtrC family response regulator